MGERIARQVTVPNVVGLPFHIGRDVASKAGVALANPDPDGPSIGSLAWPGLYYIVRQSPAHGAVLYEWDSVAVEVIKHGDNPDHEPANPTVRSPSGHRSRATPVRESYVELTGD